MHFLHISTLGIYYTYSWHIKSVHIKVILLVDGVSLNHTIWTKIHLSASSFEKHMVHHWQMLITDSFINSQNNICTENLYGCTYDTVFFTSKNWYFKNIFLGPSMVYPATVTSSLSTSSLHVCLRWTISEIYIPNRYYIKIFSVSV